MARESFAIGTVRIRAGSVRALELPITRLVTGADVTLPVRVVHGREDGPRVWIDAAIHGDEVVGVEVIRQVMAGLDPKTFRGTLVAVPVVNVLGFMTGDRYLPDRRDLNRSFPGSARTWGRLLRRSEPVWRSMPTSQPATISRMKRWAIRPASEPRAEPGNERLRSRRSGR